MISFIKPSNPGIELFNKFLAKSVEANHYTNFGVNHNTLKQKISDIVGTNRVVLVANATLALDGLHDLMSVKCTTAYLPSFTFPATNQGCRISSVMGNTYGSGQHIGRAYWWDTSDKDSYAITVNPFGSISKPCEKPKAKYWIIDNAAGILSQTSDWLANGADVVIYSLHATKILSACEGGVVVFKNDDLYEEYLEYTNFGFKQKEDGSRSIGDKGSNHKMSELSAAWCLMKLETLNSEMEARARLTDLYANLCEFNNIPFIHSLQAFWLLGKCPALILQKIAQNLGIDIRPYYQKLNITNDKDPVTHKFNTYGFCLPTRPTLTEEEIAKIINMLGIFIRDGLI